MPSRSGADLAARFPEVLSAVLALTRGRGGGVVLDGEVVALREGRLDFPALSYGPARRAREGVEVRYVAFDVLAADGVDGAALVGARDRGHRRTSRGGGVDVHVSTGGGPHVPAGDALEP